MLREQFNKLIAEEATEGFNRGIALFIESLNSDMEKESAITESENGVDDYIDSLFENAQ